jgi:hypothetical protein
MKKNFFLKKPRSAKMFSSRVAETGGQTEGTVVLRADKTVPAHHCHVIDAVNLINQKTAPSMGQSCYPAEMINDKKTRSGYPRTILFHIGILILLLFCIKNPASRQVKKVLVNRGYGETGIGIDQHQKRLLRMIKPEAPARTAKKNTLPRTWKRPRQLKRRKLKRRLKKKEPEKVIKTRTEPTTKGNSSGTPAGAETTGKSQSNV